MRRNRKPIPIVWEWTSKKKQLSKLSSGQRPLEKLPQTFSHLVRPYSCTLPPAGWQCHPPWARSHLSRTSPGERAILATFQDNWIWYVIYRCRNSSCRPYISTYFLSPISAPVSTHPEFQPGSKPQEWEDFLSAPLLKAYNKGPPNFKPGFYPLATSNLCWSFLSTL